MVAVRNEQGAAGTEGGVEKDSFHAYANRVMENIDFEKAKNTNLNTVSTRMKRLFPNHHPHELRHTFISRCKECGVLSEVVSIWAGHSLSGTITSTVYTHYSDEFQLKEAERWTTENTNCCGIAVSK